jgi:hypothetical protein
MPRRDVRRDFTSSSESEESGVDPFAEQPNKDFVIPSSVGLSDDEKLKPSQYRLQREREDADESEDEEEEEEAMIIQTRNIYRKQIPVLRKLDLQRFLQLKQCIRNLLIWVANLLRIRRTSASRI